MKSTLLILALLISQLASAHSGHPGAADHGDLTHVVIGLLFTLPLGALSWGLLRLHSAKREPVRVRKDSHHG